MDKSKNFHPHRYDDIPPSKDEIVVHPHRKCFHIHCMYMTVTDFPTEHEIQINTISGKMKASII